MKGCDPNDCWKSSVDSYRVSVLLFIACDIIELIFNYRESKSEQEAYIRSLEEENEVLRQEGKYWQHLSEVMIKCRDFIQ